jgi:aspartate carbamoyltransferase regulatory subunit
MSHDDKLLLIPKIENGFVIDHIPVGNGVRILEIVQLYGELAEAIVTLGMNLSSTKLGKKDMIKISVRELPRRVAQHISLICPGVTIKRIADYRVVERIVIEVPDTIENQVRCLNPNCITNAERDAGTRFACTDRAQHKYRCAYCERVFDLDRLAVVTLQHEAGV